MQIGDQLHGDYYWLMMALMSLHPASAQTSARLPTRTIRNNILVSVGEMLVCMIIGGLPCHYTI